MNAQPKTVTFNFDGEVVGTLYFDEKPMRFEGDCDKAAEVFWETLLLHGESLKAENQRLKAALKQINYKAFYHYNTNTKLSPYWVIGVTAKALKEGENETNT
jgi:hypothetical protein